MTDQDPSDAQIATADEFERALKKLLQSASENGIDPAGAWEYRTDDGLPNWEIMVLELEEQ